MLVTQQLRLPVTDEGVAIPKELLGDAVEVVVSREGRNVLVKFVTADDKHNASQASGSNAQDSIWNLRNDPITDDPITDSSVNHDRYLYGPEL